MFDSQKSHPLLAQVPLTISPFVKIPSAVTLPYTFKTVPATLPPSVLVNGTNDKPKYVVSASGHGAHPDDVVNSCKALQDHITKTASEGQRRLQEWESQIKERDLAEKRRVAPGWLDRDEKILQPVVARSKVQPDLLDEPTKLDAPTMAPSKEGEEIDRAFGNLGLK